MPVALTTLLTFATAAVAEIAGCFAFWAWLRQGKSIVWLAPGIVSLMLFAYLLTLAPSDHAGRAYAAYGGVYIMGRCYGCGLPKGAGPTSGMWPAAQSRCWPRRSSCSRPEACEERVSDHRRRRCRLTL